MTEPTEPRSAEGGIARADPRSMGRRADDDRTPERRADDHAAIGRLADQLLPALVAKLTATGLGEIEVREGGWQVRLRRPAGPSAQGPARRSSDRPSRSQPGHEGHGHAPGALEGHRSARSTALPGHSTNGSGAAAGSGSPALDGERGAGGSGGRRADPHSAIATSPAVGVFSPRADAKPGTRVRAGDRIGVVDMLGVPQDVVAPADGVIAGILVEPGDAVEYGQDLIAVELMTQSSAAGGGAD